MTDSITEQWKAMDIFNINETWYIVINFHFLPHMATFPVTTVINCLLSIATPCGQSVHPIWSLAFPLACAAADVEHEVNASFASVTTSSTP